MLLTSAAIAISRKVADERKKKKEARQGVLSVGNSDVARKAFNAQTQKTIQNGSVQRVGTDIKFEDPGSVDVASPASSKPGSVGLNQESEDTRPTPSAQPARRSIEKPTGTSSGVTSPCTNITDGSNTRASVPPPYPERPMSALSPSSATTNTSPSLYSRDSDAQTLVPSDTRSVYTASTNSQRTHALRVKTKGSDLSSGFPYHPALFDMNVHPSLWDEFTNQVVRTTKFGVGDHAQIWAAATATALTGAFVTSIFVGRGMNRHVQEKKVKEGLKKTSDDSLGATLEQWNDTYFRERGLFAHLELSESAMKQPDQKSRVFRRETGWYNKEARDRKRDERKFVIVLTRLDEQGLPSEARQELAAEGPGMMPELPNVEDPKVNLVEAPGDFEQPGPVELPGDFMLPGSVSLGFGGGKFAPPAGFAELGDTTARLELSKLHDDDEQEPQHDNEATAGRASIPEPLAVNSKTA